LRCQRYCPAQAAKAGYRQPMILGSRNFKPWCRPSNRWCSNLAPAKAPPACPLPLPIALRSWRSPLEPPSQRLRRSLSNLRSALGLCYQNCRFYSVRWLRYPTCCLCFVREQRYLSHCSCSAPLRTGVAPVPAATVAPVERFPAPIAGQQRR